MITYYCPNCWSEISEHDEVCPNCGYKLEEYSRLSLEEKLIMSLHHPVLDSRMVAVQILGNQGSVKALSEFENIIEDETSDFYLLREVIFALSKITDPRSVEILRKASLSPSPLIRNLANEQLKIKEGNR